MQTRKVATRLRSEGYAVDVVHELDEARTRRWDVDYDGLLLDRDLDDGDALDLVSELRQADDAVPILVMSGRGSSADRLLGLQVGADDYLAKPVDADELLLRLRKILIRSTGRPQSDTAPVEVIGRLGLARDIQEAYLDGKPVTLSATQYCLVEYLLTNRRREVTAEDLLGHCWDEHLPSTSRPLPPQLTRVRAAFKGALVLELVRYRTYRVWVEGEEGADPPDL